MANFLLQNTPILKGQEALKLAQNMHVLMSLKLISRKNLSGRKIFDNPHCAYDTFAKQPNFYNKKMDFYS